MAHLPTLFFVLVLALNLPQYSEAQGVVTKTLFMSALQLYKDLTAHHAFSNGITVNSQTPINLETVVDKGLATELHRLSNQFEDFQKKLFVKIASDLQDKFTHKTDILFDHVKDVQRAFLDFLRIYENYDSYPPADLLKFAQDVTFYGKAGLKSSILSMHEALTDVDIKRENLLSIIAKSSSVRSNLGNVPVVTGCLCIN